jgi:hypothetical protein
VPENWRCVALYIPLFKAVTAVDYTTRLGFGQCTEGYSAYGCDRFYRTYVSKRKIYVLEK